MTRSILLLLGVLTTTTLLAVGPVHSPTNSEFFFREIEGLKGGPNAFLRAHAARLAGPGQADESYLSTTARNAWSTHQGLLQLKQTRDQARARAQAAEPHPEGAANKPGASAESGVWRFVGPYHEQTPSPFSWDSSSGRVTGLAIEPGCNEDQCILYAGTAGGGLWKARKALHQSNPRWRRLSNGLLSNNIGSVDQDPNDSRGRTIYVGTGESNFTFTSMAGKGLFKTTNGGKEFTRVSTLVFDPDFGPESMDFTATRGISRVVVKPGDPDTLYVSTTVASQGMTSVRGGQSTLTGGPQAKLGLYRTTDGGASWTLLFEVPENRASNKHTHKGALELISGVKDVQLDPLDSSTVWISVVDDGLYRSAPSLEGGDASFRKVFGIVGEDLRGSNAAFDLVVKSGATRVYLYNGSGNDLEAQGMYRLDDAGIPARELYDGADNSAKWKSLTNIDTALGAMDWGICGGQCIYDLVVASPQGYPDTVFVGGQFTRYTWDGVIRSVDGGRNFFSSGVDVQSPPRRLHVDVRALVFHPDDPDIVFVGSDGGVTRTNGNYADATDYCGVDIFAPDSGNEWACKAGWREVPEKLVFMNRGLKTMQLYNISAAQKGPLNHIIAGTQDNSTQWNVGTGNRKNWTQILPVGDGTSANGFHRKNRNIIFGSYQSSHFFTNFESQPGLENWLYTGGPITFSNERLYPNAEPGSGRQFMTFDPLVPDRQFTGYEHVWRTNNNGGDQSTLAANGCAMSGEWFKETCGDWEPIGDYLTRKEFGGFRRGGVISAVERSAADAGTLWAATTLGRVFISHNADAAANSVQFQRLDTSRSPTRFISGIAVDHENPNRAFISYSGFNGITPKRPGHVFEVVFDPATSMATFSRIDHNLADMPVNHIVRDDLSGDLFAATDFGVLTLPAGQAEWEIAGNGLPAVLTPHLEIHPQARKLFAATHGLGGWYMDLAEVP
jgi:hypothetical protein